MVCSVTSFLDQQSLLTGNYAVRVLRMKQNSGLRYLLKIWSSCETMQHRLCRQSTTSCGGAGPPPGWVLCMELGSKPRALNTSQLKHDRIKWPQGLVKWNKNNSFIKTNLLKCFSFFCTRLRSLYRMIRLAAENNTWKEHEVFAA